MDSERLLIERARQHLSRQELAERSGVNAHTISEMERGVRNPRATTVVKIAEALGLEPEQLLGKALAPNMPGSRGSGEGRSDANDLVHLEIALQRIQGAGNAAQKVAREWRHESTRSLEEGRSLTRYRILEMYSFSNVLTRLYVDALGSIIEGARLGTVGLVTDEGVTHYLSPDPALWPRELRVPLREAGAYIAALPGIINTIEAETSEQSPGATEEALYEEFNVEANRADLDKVLAKVAA